MYLYRSFAIFDAFWALVGVLHDTAHNEAKNININKLRFTIMYNFYTKI
ncbi:MAG: hypothetical protein IKK40_07845 [Bacteroidales bacterium]|nr:hypothetical protein [Bacteroidales bacterium]